jgi:hypothetical protein
METGKKLSINCGLACLLSDQEGTLDAYAAIQINCGQLIVSRAVYAKLSGERARINTGLLQVVELKGRILRLDGNTILDAGADLKDRFVIVDGSLIVREGGLEKLGEAGGLIVLDKLYYPEPGNLASLAGMIGGKRSYPAGAHVLLGDQSLAVALAALPPGVKHLWIDGALNALDAKTLETARAAGIRIDCASLFTYEGLYAAYGGLFHCPDPVLVGDGYEITGDLQAAKLVFYGPKVYVNGDFSMEAKDLPLLEALEAIVIRGRATLPGSAIQTFRKKGRAGDYELIEGRLVTINGNAQWGHRQFAESRAAGRPEEKLTIQVNGCLIFDDDVTEEDLDCVAALSCNGVVLLPSRLKGVLASRIKEAHGFIGDKKDFEALKAGGGNEPAGPADEDEVSINTGSYILI